MDQAQAVQTLEVQLPLLKKAQSSSSGNRHVLKNFDFGKRSDPLDDARTHRDFLISLQIANITTKSDFRDRIRGSEAVIAQYGERKSVFCVQCNKLTPPEEILKNPKLVCDDCIEILEGEGRLMKR